MEMVRIGPEDMKRQELLLYNESSEVQLRRYYEPEEGLFIAESLRVLERALDAGYEPVSLLIEDRHVQDPLVKRIGDIPVYVGSAETLGSLAGYKLTGGALSLMRRRKLPKAAELLKDAKRVVVLESINNPTNVGAIFRSAAALGADAILLTPDCSDPLYRRAARVSMGTVFALPWCYFGANEAADLSLLRECGFTSLAMALREGAEALGSIELSRSDKRAVLLGNENNGLAEATVAASDHCVVIPMQNGVDSLNVAAASAVAFWELFR
ncbi:MAG: RNA methyltransferase [Lachnospiraceae bacterium]|nr:RNA methyltransferase [Lachnospiraceae bacterium]